MPNHSDSHRLLPDDAYPRDKITGELMSAQKKDLVDRTLRARLSEVPTVPGTYTDPTGDTWVLAADNRWTDHHGYRRDARYTPIIALMGPMALVTPSSKD